MVLVESMAKFLIASQSITDMAIKAVTTNGLPLYIFEKLSIAKKLAPMLDQLNLRFPTYKHGPLMLIREI